MILDSSITLTLVFADAFNSYSEAVFAAVRKHGTIVPALGTEEVANILAHSILRKRIDQAKAVRFLEFLSRLPINIDTVVNTSTMKECFNLAQKYNLTAYDASYLRLALNMQLPLASKDKALNQAALAAGVELFT